MIKLNLRLKTVVNLLLKLRLEVDMSKIIIKGTPRKKPRPKPRPKNEKAPYRLCNRCLRMVKGTEEKQNEDGSKVFFFKCRCGAGWRWTQFSNSKK